MMCYACEEAEAENMGRGRRVTMSPAECAESDHIRRGPLNILGAQSPGTSIHRVLEEMLARHTVGPTNEEMDRMEEARRELERAQGRGPGRDRTVVIIARDARECAEFCRERGWDPASRGVVFVRAGEARAEASLRGRSRMEIYRVEGAQAHPHVERLLRHMVSREDVRMMEDNSWVEARRREFETEARRREEAFRRFYGNRTITSEDVRRAFPEHPVSPEIDNPRMTATGRMTIHYVPETQQARPRGRMPRPWDEAIPETYVPHGEIHTEPQDETAWHEPAHWASTLERSPFWYRAEQVLRTDAGDYRADELDLDIRYV